MNAMNEEKPEQPKEPDIILIAFEKKSYYMFKGDDHLNQLLLADGVFPKPVLCVHFDSIIDAKRALGDRLNLGNCWGIHPNIVERLRTTNSLIETDA